jgi:2-haloacid dehalogenase
VLDEAIAMSMVDTLTGVFRRFPDLLQGAFVRRATLAGLPLEPVPAALEAAAALPARPEAAAALDHLREHGHDVAVLTNSAAVAGRHALDAAGLLVRVDRIDGADAVRAYKPDPRVYELTVAPEHAWFVAAHWWDVTGAARAGFRTAWISQADVVLPETAAVPDVSAPDLLGAVREITAR